MLLHVSVTSNHHQADISVRGHEHEHDIEQFIIIMSAILHSKCKQYGIP